MTALAVLPYLDVGLMHESFESLHDSRIEVALVNNCHKNTGVTRPWANAARRVLADDGYDWLVLWSTAIVFGPARGHDFADALDHVEHYPCTEIPRMVSGIGCGWHLHAIHRDVLARVGVFDDGVFFAYYEDSDWIYRHQLAGLGNLWRDGNIQAPVDLAVNRGDGHSIHRALVSPDLVAGQRAYVRKWGGMQQRERYDHPYNDCSLDWTYTGRPPREDA